jgi:hypothetical protein
VRLTRNGFSLRGERLCVAKVGYLRGMIAKRVRAGRADIGMLAQVQWLSANAGAIDDALAAALP